MTRSTFFAWLLLVFSCSRAHAGDRAYVSNESAGTVSVIDVATDRVVDTVAVGGRPGGIVAAPDGRSVLVAMSRSVAMLDTATLQVTRLAPPGADPHGFALVAISPDGRFAYVTAETSNRVSVIDTAKAAVVASFLAGPRPRAAAFSRDGTLAFVTSEDGGSLSVVDAVRHVVIARLCFGRPDQRPAGVAVTRDARRLFVATGRANTVAVIDVSDPRQPRVEKEIAAGTGPEGLALDSGGRRLYAANEVSNDVSVIDTQSLSVVTTISAGDGPSGVAIAPAPPSARYSGRHRRP